MADDTNDLHRASQIFDIEHADPGSPLADSVWRTRSVPLASFTSVATPYWQIVVTRHRDRSFFTVRGPETRPTVSPIPQDAEFVGVQFRLGTFISRFSAPQLVDRAIFLPHAGRLTFWLDGSAWELPTFDNAIVGAPINVSGFVRVSDQAGNDLGVRGVPNRLLLVDGPTEEGWDPDDLELLLPPTVEIEPGTAVASADPEVFATVEVAP